MEKYGKKLIYSCKGDFGLVEVVEDDEIRSLHLGTPIVQNSMYISDPYTLVNFYLRTSMLSLTFNPNPSSVLVLGLGGGGMVKFLWKHFPDCEIDAVERDGTIVDISYRFFELPKSSRVHIFVEDALGFLNSSAKNWDIIFVDLFEPDSMSPLVRDMHFFTECYNRLTPNGILAWNTWPNATKDFMQDSINALCKSFGKKLLVLPDEKNNNIVILAFRDPESYSLEQVMKNSWDLYIKTHMHFPVLIDGLNNFQGYGNFLQTEDSQ